MNATLTVSDLRSRLERGEHFHLIDVRSREEFDHGHIPGANNIPIEQTEARLDDIPADEPVVLVCLSGRRADSACNQLRSKRSNLVVLEGGTSAWSQAGLPVVAQAKSSLSVMRQTQILVGLVVLAASAMVYFGSAGWLGVLAFVGLGLTFAGGSGVCPMALLVAKMPWNSKAKAH
jgi:rhodanese-related sulfurtransferase